MRSWTLMCLGAFVGTAVVLLGASSTPKASNAPDLAWSREAPVNTVTWKPVASFTFDDPAQLAAFPVPKGTWEIKKGRLWAVAGEQDRAILLAHVSGDAVRIAFDATNYARPDSLIGDITVLLNSAPEADFFNMGYALTTGSYYNNCTTFYREHRKIARTEWSPVVSGKKNRMALELYRGHLRYWMNGKILLEAWEPQPMPLAAERWVGLRTWATLMAVDNVVIAQPAQE